MEPPRKLMRMAKKLKFLTFDYKIIIALKKGIYSSNKNYFFIIGRNVESQLQSSFTVLLYSFV